VGLNNYGQLGFGSTGNLVSTPIESLLGIEIKDISAGEFHSTVIIAEGKVYGWGYKIFAQVGVPQPVLTVMATGATPDDERH
jgi:alpha-tubulin suppressor-like RCC1 family protein